ncbi:hypothetical protein EUGRSUZ_K03100 [Eucalyptus grandis]|uniref:Uncharacterized protein n=2 Tax=Eucalyptus grandis TaxID=71139 RepID=A0ACC3IYU1_EUCGR|nr:hypothetical protein EUGRSUZ_K03100 [Eucalyptus grandis]
MLVVIVLAVFLLANVAVSPEIGDFTYSGFKSANLSLDGLAVLTGTSLLRLTNVTKQKNSFSGAVHLFSTTFVFAIIPKYPALGGHGFAFVIAPTGYTENNVQGFRNLSLISVFAVAYAIRKHRKFSEVLENWDHDYSPHRFKYKDLYVATKGFGDEELLGAGGLNKNKNKNKKVLSTSKPYRSFLNNRNIVTLLGYYHWKDKYLYNQPKVTLNWSQRFRVIKGVAYGLSYLNEGWEQAVIHRDIKASNILLDLELNGRLGDFGLAKRYNHGIDPQSTHVVGTLGYMALENNRTASATTSTYVYAFGAFCSRSLLEEDQLRFRRRMM